LRRHLSYSNVVSTLCLFIVLGGTSYAVATGSIDSREVKNNTIRSRDVRNNDVRSRDVRNRTLVARDHLGNSLGGDQIDESKLGKVPSAGSADSALNSLALGGRPASDFAGKPLSRSAGFEESETGDLLEVPGYGTLEVSGCDPSASEVDLQFRSAVSQLYWRTSLALANDTVFEALSPGEVADDFTLAAIDGATGTLHLVRSDEQPGQALIEFAFAQTNQGTICRVAAIAFRSD
jgi:hypothetical protein